MDHADFRMGLEFRCGDGCWRVTDVGTRTVVAIRIDQATVASLDPLTGQRTQRIVDPIAEHLVSGPPYAVAETVFGEDDWEACEWITAPGMGEPGRVEAAGLPPEASGVTGSADDDQPHSHWNYRLVRWACGSVALHEVYYTDGKADGVTLRPIDFVASGDDEQSAADAVAEVRRMLRVALGDATHRPVLDCSDIAGCARLSLTIDDATPVSSPQPALVQHRNTDQPLRRSPFSDAPDPMFCLRIGGEVHQELTDATQRFADVWHRTEQGKQVHPEIHVSFPNWSVFAETLRAAGVDGQTQGHGGQSAADAVVGALRSLGYGSPNDEDARRPGGVTGEPAVVDGEPEATSDHLRWIQHHEHDDWEPGLGIGGGRYEAIGSTRPIHPFAVGPRLVAPVKGRQKNTEASPSSRFVPPEFGQAKPVHHTDSLVEMLRQDGADCDVEIPLPAYPDERDSLVREIQRLRDACAEAYQVVGALGDLAGVFDTPELVKALDNLAAASRGEPCPHADLLPFALGGGR